MKDGCFCKASDANMEKWIIRGAGGYGSTGR